MSSQRESLWEKIKKFFKNLFKKEKIEALPEPEIEMKIEPKVEQNIEQTQGIMQESESETKLKSENKTEQPINIKSKEEYLDLYKKIKENQIDINTLTKEDLIMFVKFGKAELQFLENRIESEKTEITKYKKEIVCYQNNLVETA